MILDFPFFLEGPIGVMGMECGGTQIDVLIKSEKKKKRIRKINNFILKHHHDYFDILSAII